MWLAAPLLLILACGQKNNPQPEETPTEQPDGDVGKDKPVEAPVPEPAEPAEPTPESLYAECQERVEGMQAEGECTADADCKTAGCGNEVCTTAAAAAEVMTTCDNKPCYKVLDTCGCNEGQCTWSLKDEIPKVEGPAPAPLPPTRLPPSPPAEGGK